MITRFALLGLVMFVGVASGQHPSAAEFNLFCRILAEANNMMYGPDYVYDENVDRAILKDMEVLYNATTGNMDEFRKTLWVTKDFFEEHPPPTDPKNREDAHREIDKLIREGEKKIEENKEIEEKVNKEINEAKLSVAKGIFGDEVKELPKQDGNLTEILTNVKSIFNDHNSAMTSCGGKDKAAGKTLLNDFFCVCVGDTDGAQGPCSPHILPPKKSGSGNNAGWKAMKLKDNKAVEFKESFKQIEEVCNQELMGKEEQKKDMTGLLVEYVGLIGKGGAKNQDNKIFGHSERSKGHNDVNKVEKCDGSGGKSHGTGNNDKHNENICVDYRHNQNGDGKYDIPWHTKFKNYTTFMKDAKKLEDQILKNRADLLLLKSQAWVAYSREKDDETSNLDDMNVSNLFDGARASDKKDTMAEKKTEEREYIDVSEETTQPSQPSQPVQGQGAPGNPPHYILISSTETSQPSPKKTDEGKGDRRVEPEVTVISSESATQEAASSKAPSQAPSQPPTQSAKRLRDEDKTGE